MVIQRVDRRQDALGAFHVLPDELVCKILCLQLPRDIGNLACVSSVFYILCNEEPLWMQLCLEHHEGTVDFKGTWKQTALAKLDLKEDLKAFNKSSRHFQGFDSAFLYRRWYRCHIALEKFSLDNGAVERRNNVLSQEFSASYDGKKPVLLTDLLDDWPARKTWSLDQLVQKCGGTMFKVAQPHGKPVSMTLEDFARYMDLQRDEEPLYIFDPKFGESVPELLNDYKVPKLFSEDFFSVLSESDRPPYRWLVMGPAKSGASWHVDPSLTSAWNSLLSGRKRWALYRPGKVPPGVTLDVDEDDGSVSYDGPTSLQWWLDVYPHLKDEDKPLECTQLPGETIYVPSGWWHCVLNIDASIAVTQNFVNLNNLEIVCMDLAPGYRHRAIARAGIMALEGEPIAQDPQNWTRMTSLGDPVFQSIENTSPALSESYLGVSTNDGFKERNCNVPVESEALSSVNSVKCLGGVTDQNLLLALHVLLEETKAISGEGRNVNNRGDSITRKWLQTLWLARPELQQTIWKGACLALDAGTWLQRINVICNTLGFPRPADEEQLPVGDGSNPVYLVGDYVIKLYIQEAGPDALIECLGSELNFYTVLKDSGSSLQDVVPEVVASGILYPNDDDYVAVPWDGTGDCPQVYQNGTTVGKKRHRDSPRITKERFRTKWAARNSITKENKKTPLAQDPKFWPYLVTKRCEGKPLVAVQKNMTKDDHQLLAQFLGNQIRLLHTLPLPSLEHEAKDSEGLFITKKLCGENLVGRVCKEAKHDLESPFVHESFVLSKDAISPTYSAAVVSRSPESDSVLDVLWPVPDAWNLQVSYLRERRRTVYEKLNDWGCLPDHLLQQVEAYLPKDPVVLVGDVQVHDTIADISMPPVWLHLDVMGDNIIVEETWETIEIEHPAETEKQLSQKPVIRPQYIIDFGDLFHGDRIYDLLPIHLDVFNLDNNLLECFLKSYQLPFSSKFGVRHVRGAEGPESHSENKLSYCAMCYCLLHHLDAMTRIFKLRPDMKTAMTLQEIEDSVWGVLNNYIPDNDGLGN